MRVARPSMFSSAAFFFQSVTLSHQAPESARSDFYSAVRLSVRAHHRHFETPVVIDGLADDLFV